MRTVMIFGIAAALAGCATTRAAPPMAIEGEEISYETTPCFGACPVYRVTIRPDGSGIFEGKRFTSYTGTREIRATPDDYRRFAASLAPYKPNGERRVQPGTPDCRNAPTDMPSVDVHWSEMSGAAHHLSVYYGCRQGNEAMVAALQAAPLTLPIGDLVGRR